MYNTIHFAIIPFAIFFFLHFSLNYYLKRAFLKRAVFLSFVLLVYSSVYFFIGSRKYCSVEIITLVPSAYLLNALVFRYILFNKFFCKWTLNRDTEPYDPIIVLPGSLYTKQTSERRPATIIEFIYSVWILLFPWFFIYLATKNCPSKPLF